MCLPEIYCDLPEVLPLSDITVVGDLRVGTTVNYTCEDGYLLTSGVQTRECLASGNWSEEAPSCGRTLNETRACCAPPYIPYHICTLTSYREIWEVGTPKGLSKTVLNSKVVLFLMSIYMY